MSLKSALAALLVLSALLCHSGTAQAQQPQSYTLTLTPAQLNVLGKALEESDQPYRTMAPLIQDLLKQIQAQNQPPAPPVVTPPPVEDVPPAAVEEPAK